MSFACQGRMGLVTDFPDRVSPEEKQRRRQVIRGWSFKLDGPDLRFAHHCMEYLKGYRDDPPPGYADDQTPQ